MNYWDSGIRSIDQTLSDGSLNTLYYSVLIMDEAKSEQNFEEEEYIPKSILIEILTCIVQEAVDQLCILKTVYAWPEEETLVHKYMTLEERFSEQVETESMNTVENTLVPKNCAFIESLLSNLFKELKNKQSYDDFFKTIGIILRMKADEEKLQVEATEKEREVRRLQDILYEEKENYTRKIMECMENTGRIKDKIEDYRLESEIKLEYIKSWQNSKIEMNDVRFKQKHQEIQDKIRTVDIDINKEVRVHQEVSSAFDLIQKTTEVKNSSNQVTTSSITFKQTQSVGHQSILEFEAIIETWKNKYNEDLKIMNEKVRLLQEKQDKQLEEISKRKELYASRQKEIDDYKQYKIEQEKIRLEMERRNKAATIIESWWRGTMVRKGFGKYRKKKEKKGKKKSSEKKSAK